MSDTKYRGDHGESRRLRQHALSYENNAEGTECTMTHTKAGLQPLRMVAPIDPATNRVNHEYMRRFKDEVIAREADRLYRVLVDRGIDFTYDTFLKDARQPATANHR